ncbi:hypothetical protein BDZ89DRAFT_1043349 [Hymenopellis radicata]|nr:hypothetical protein BDZ89DRAFT_1043349 [Hymenopellis radicata]
MSEYTYTPNAPKAAAGAGAATSAHSRRSRRRRHLQVGSERRSEAIASRSCFLGKAIHEDLVEGELFSFCYGINDQMVQPLAFSTKSTPSPVFLFVYKEEYYFYNFDSDSGLVRFHGRFASHEDFLSQFKGEYAIMQMGVEVPTIQREIPDKC